MTNIIRSRVNNDAPTQPGPTPKHLTKQEFAQRLHRLMMQKGWRQSDLARRADLPRDSISVYIRGKSVPTPQSIDKLALALGVTPEELFPNYVESAIDNDVPEMEMKVSPNAPHIAWLRVNRYVTVEVANEIMGLLINDKPVVATK